MYICKHNHLIWDVDAKCKSTGAHILWPKVRERQVDAAQILPETLRGQNPGSWGPGGPRGTLGPWTGPHPMVAGLQRFKTPKQPWKAWCECALAGKTRIFFMTVDLIMEKPLHPFFQSHFKYSDVFWDINGEKNMKKHMKYLRRQD